MAQLRTFTYYDLARELSKLSGQIEAYGSYRDEQSRDQAWAQIKARAEKLSTMGIKIEVLPVFRAQYASKEG